MSQGYDPRLGKLIATLATSLPPLSSDRLSQLVSNPAEVRKVLYGLMSPVRGVTPGAAGHLVLGTYKGSHTRAYRRHFAANAPYPFKNMGSVAPSLDFERMLHEESIPLEANRRKCFIAILEVGDLGFPQDEMVDERFVVERAETVGLKPVPEEAMFVFAEKCAHLLPTSIPDRLSTLAVRPSEARGRYTYFSVYRNLPSGDVCIAASQFGPMLSSRTRIIFEKVLQ